MASAEGLLEALEQLVWLLWDTAREEPLRLFLSLIVPLAVLGVLCVRNPPEQSFGKPIGLTKPTQIYLVLHLFAPKPRAPIPSEKTYISTNPDGTVSAPRPLPCWYDRWRAEGRLSHEYPTIPAGFPVPDEAVIEPAEVEMSVVIPAYNEEARITVALEEMVEYLDHEFGRPNGQSPRQEEQPKPTQRKGKKGKGATHAPHRLVFNPSTTVRSPQQETTPGRAGSTPSGYEILIVDDGSRDRTVEVALAFSHQHGLHDILRVIKLARNRGKGGAVTHGLRHVRGQYAVFADADGASRFSDLGRLTEGCEDVVDGSNRGVAIGSRAHLVGSEAVVKVSFLSLVPSAFPVFSRY